MAHIVRSAYDPYVGKALKGADVHVVTPGTTNLMTIYSDKDFSIQKTNPIVMNDAADIDFYLPMGTRYDLLFKVGGMTVKVVVNQEAVGSDN